MRPDPPIALQRIAQALVSEIAPHLSDPFAQQTAGLAATIAAMLAEEWDRAAARLAEENASLRALFAAAADLAPPELAGRLRAAAARSDADLRISRLQAANDELRRLLIELQAWCEGQNDPRIAALNEAIWEQLKESTRRRRLVARPL